MLESLLHIPNEIKQSQGGLTSSMLMLQCLYALPSWFPLGYFIGLSKSCLVPQQSITFLDFIVDSMLCAFLNPEFKKKKVADLRESILTSR